MRLPILETCLTLAVWRFHVQLRISPLRWRAGFGGVDRVSCEWNYARLDLGPIGVEVYRWAPDCGCYEDDDAEEG